MVKSKCTIEQLKGFNKILDDFQNIEVKFDDEDKSLILLSSFLISFEHFNDAFLHKKKSTNALDEFQSTIRTKDLTKLQDLKVEDSKEDKSV